MVGKSVMMFGLRIILTAMGFIFTLVMSRNLGAGGAGMIAEAIGLVTILGTLSRMGMDQAVMTQKWDEKEGDSIGRMVGGKILPISYAMAAVAAFIYSYIYGMTDKTIVMLIMLSGIYCFNRAQIESSIMIAQGRSYRAAIIQNGILPTVCIVILVVCNVSDPKLLAIIYCAVLWLVLLYLNVGKKNKSECSGGLMRNNYLWAIAVLTATYYWADIIYLANSSSAEEAGIFNVVKRLSSVGNVFLVGASMVLVNRVRMIGKNERDKEAAIKNVILKSTLMVVTANIMFMAFYAAVGRDILTWYGKEFESGYHTLVLMCISQLINAVTGITGQVLLMLKQEKQVLTVLSVAILVFFLSLSINNTNGMEKVAWANIYFMIVLNVGFWYVYRTTGKIVIS